MRLKSLEINGFKSFAKKTSLEFLVPIVAIVGPNGSGKSNVAEAFRFVLGEQSMKSLRGKRGEDLIFNGSKTAPKMNRASVKLLFDNHDRMFPLELDEIFLERAVYRDSANEYLINGSHVRLRDITELLSSANIGSSGHHIISQGEADRLLNASSKERREMIEDALGLKIYQYKKEESERKLEKTSENIAQVSALRKEIAPHIAFLGKQAERVKKGEQLRDEFRSAAKEYLRREEIYLAREKHAIEGEKRGPLHEMKELEKKISSAREALSASKDAALEREILSAGAKFQEMRKGEEETRFALGRIEGEISAEKKALARALSEGRARNSVPLSDLELFSENFRSGLEESKHENDISNLRALIERLWDAFSGILSARPDSKETESIESDIAELEKRKRILEKEREEAEEKAKGAEDNFRALERESKQRTETLRESERDIFTLLSRQNELSGILSGFRSREEAIARSSVEFQEELREIQALGGASAVYISHFDIIENEQVLSEEEIFSEARSTQEARRKRLERMKIRLEEIGGGSGEDVLKEFEEAKTRDEFLMKEIEDLKRSAESLKTLIRDLSEKLRSEFSTGLSKINKEFSTFFSLMFGGGEASLSLQKIEKRRKSIFDEADMEMDEEENERPEEGIEISVSLPHKRIRGLEALSGGERALTSIALLFAVSQVNPPPFVILDETDAALDEANSRKYGDMIENLAKHSQLILITHNRETMSRAGVLYGVTMGADASSRLLSVRFDEAVSVAK